MEGFPESPCIIGTLSEDEYEYNVVLLLHFSTLPGISSTVINGWSSILPFFAPHLTCRNIQCCYLLLDVMLPRSCRDDLTADSEWEYRSGRKLITTVFNHVGVIL